MSLILTASEILKVMDMDLALAAAAEAFRAYGEGRVNMPPKSYLTLAKGDFRAMYGEIRLTEGHICGLKWVNVHPENPHQGLLTVMAKILLNDPETGLEFADLDGTHITNYRTGAAGGLAAKVLAREDAARLGVIGCGQQAITQVAAIVRVRGIEEITVFDRHLHHSQSFAGKMAQTYGLKARAVEDIRDAVENQDIVVTTTPSETPIVFREWVAPGSHINAIGADAAGKQELDPAILRVAKIVVDDWAQASHSGEINVPLSRGELKPEQVYGSLGEVVAGKKPGRENREEITVFDSTGLIIQDLALGFAVYRRAQERGLGEEKDFLK
ncbi:MAG: ornithine cyclodeaminase family protein [Deltaproteobacteria bacterium]|nr:ornithine cyclodeaminase family protein [Deltaproteobacteria bacterium]